MITSFHLSELNPVGRVAASAGVTSVAALGLPGNVDIQNAPESLPGLWPGLFLSVCLTFSPRWTASSSFVCRRKNQRDQLDIAVHQTAHNFDGGLDRLAQMMGMGAQTLRNKTNPNSETHKLALREALAMMLHAGDYRILEVMAAQCGYTVKNGCGTDASSIIVALLRVEAEHGDVSRSMADALTDGKVTPREAAQIRQEISEARKALDDLERLVVGRYA